jgi:2-methylcitrate dehydratase PrpD
MSTSVATITERLADHVVGLRFEDIPPAVVAKAKELLAHHLATAVRGRDVPRARRAVDVALGLNPTGGPCTIIGERCGAGALDAAFANGSLMAGVGTADAVLPPGVNAGLATHPAAWAIGELTGATGRELLTAVVASYDVACRVHGPVWTWDLAVPRPLKFVAQPFGAAAVTARLRGFDREQTVHALGHAGQAGAGVYEGSAQHWLLHPISVRNGMLAALLAESGLPASPSIVEAPHGLYRSYFLDGVPDAVHDRLDTLGRDFDLSQARINSGTTSMLNLVPVELARNLMAEHRLTAARIAAIDLVLPEERASREAAYHSYQHRSPRHLLALVATGGGIEAARFDAPPGPEVVAMTEKVRLRFEPGHSMTYARLELTTTGGEHLVAEDDTHHATPLDWTAVLARPRLVKLLRNLEAVPDVKEVMQCLTP